MTVPIMNYVKYSNVNGAQGLLSHLRSFAAAQGWTVHEYVTGKTWVTGVGWTTGSSDIDFLEISSNGWGGQDLHYRFEAYPHATEATVSILNHNAIIPGNPYPYSIATSTRPNFQNDWQDSRWYDTNMPNATFPNLWIFGYEQKYLFWYAQITTEWGIGGGHGTLMLLPEFHSINNFQFAWSGLYSDRFPQCWWYNIASNAGFWGTFIAVADNADSWRCMYDTVRAGGIYNTAIRANVFISRGRGISGNFGTLQHCVNYNSFTNKYCGIQPTWYYKDQPTGLWHVLGDLPCIVIPFQGLGFGESIDFGGDEYLAFSSCKIEDSWGIAFRIS